MSNSYGLSVSYVTPDEVYAATTVLPALCIVLVAIRWYRRWRLELGIGWDDILLLPALLFTTGAAITLLVGVHAGAVAVPTPSHGNWTPIEALTATDPILVTMGKLQYAFILQVTLAYGFIKLSITFLYRRLFVVHQGSLFDWICWILVIINIAWTISFFIVLALGCGTHVSANWGNLLDFLKYCRTIQPQNYAYVLSDLATDGLVWLLPVVMMWGLRMTWRRRLAIFGVLALGAISVVAAVIKTVLTLEAFSGLLPSDSDPNMVASTTLYWCLVEASLAVIASCLPMTYEAIMASHTLSSFAARISTTLKFHSIREPRHIESVSTSEQDMWNRPGADEPKPAPQQWQDRFLGYDQRGPSVEIRVSTSPVDMMRRHRVGESWLDVEAARGTGIKVSKIISHRSSAAM